jgi:hypothetical protein
MGGWIVKFAVGVNARTALLSRKTGSLQDDDDEPAERGAAIVEKCFFRSSAVSDDFFYVQTVAFKKPNPDSP